MMCMTTHGRKVNYLLWNARHIFHSMFSYGLKKIISIFIWFPNIKKVKILTPIISETMQSNLECIQQSFHTHTPLVLPLYTTV